MDEPVVYEPVTKMGTAMTKFLMTVWEKLGKPEDASTDAGWKMIEAIIKVWTVSFPDESQDTITANKDQRDVERTAHEAVKADGGYFSASYPPRLYHMLKACLPKQRLNDKKFIKKFTGLYPMFKATNYHL